MKTTLASFVHVKAKKPAWSNTFRVLDHAGLLFDEPPGSAEVPFVWSSEHTPSL